MTDYLLSLLLLIPSWAWKLGAAILTMFLLELVAGRWIEDNVAEGWEDEEGFHYGKRK